MLQIMSILAHGLLSYTRIISIIFNMAMAEHSLQLMCLSYTGNTVFEQRTVVLDPRISHMHF